MSSFRRRLMMAQGGGGGQIPSDNGIYILDTNGKYWTKDNWDISNNDNAVGVALISDLHPDGGFVIAPDEFKDTYLDNLSDLQIQMFDDNTALTDYNGFEWTNIIYKYLSDTGQLDYGYNHINAIESCHEYVFKNGNNGYLPSIGELKLIIDNSDIVEECLNLINGDSFINMHEIFKYDYKRSSTIKNNTESYRYYQHKNGNDYIWDLGTVGNLTNVPCEARPCCKLK